LGLALGQPWTLRWVSFAGPIQRARAAPERAQDRSERRTGASAGPGPRRARAALRLNRRQIGAPSAPHRRPIGAPSAPLHLRHAQSAPNRQPIGAPSAPDRRPIGAQSASHRRPSIFGTPHRRPSIIGTPNRRPSIVGTPHRRPIGAPSAPNRRPIGVPSAPIHTRKRPAMEGLSGPGPADQVAYAHTVKAPAPSLSLGGGSDLQS
jgi:hypothetical protein